MFVPDNFSLTDKNTIKTLINDYGFATLVSVIDERPYATHLPLMVETGEDDEWILFGHMAKANPHWRNLESNKVMAIFQGPHAYVSPTWYANGGVPTWNYMVIHMYGVAKLVDRNQLRNIVEDLSEQYERFRDDPWIPDYADGMLDAIVGFKIIIEEIQGKSKLSQNKDVSDRLNVISGFEQSAGISEIKLAAVMKKNTTN